MSNQQFVVDSADRSNNDSFTVPESTGFSTDTNQGGSCQRWYIHVNNGFDVGVDLDVRGSHYRDEVMSDAAQDGQTITLAAGEADFIDGESAHSFIDVDVDPASTPTSGSLSVTYQTREW